MYTLRVECFCGFGPRPVDIFVVGDSVVSRRFHDDGSIVPESIRGVYPTIDGLFAIINEAIRQRPYRLDVTYDRSRGFPTLIDIDYERGMADDEIRRVATSFSPLEFLRTQ